MNTKNINNNSKFSIMWAIVLPPDLSINIVSITITNNPITGIILVWSMFIEIRTPINARHDIAKR
jgi:hypothetical protein